MSIRTVLSLASLVCLVPLAACEESDDPAREADAEAASPGETVRDGGSPTTAADANVLLPSVDSGLGAQPQPSDGAVDASTPAPVADGAVPSTGNDGGKPTSATGARFWLPTTEPDNTAEPTVEVDAQGNVHTVFPAYAGGGAYYSFCSAGSCTKQEDAKVVAFATDGTVANVMLALTADGKPRVLLSSFARIEWAECDQNCTDRASWSVTTLLEHGSDRAVTGEALALDPQGRPRFLFHSYRALFGIGQKTPETLLARCDAACSTATNWKFDVIAKNEIWEGSSLRYDAAGKAHVATFVYEYDEGERVPKTEIGAYLSCEGECNFDDSFNGIGFLPPYESMTEAVSMDAAISLALTKSGKPRVAQIGKSADGKKRVSYFECNDNCQGDNWRGGTIIESDAIDSGIDLALDASDRPRIVHTLSYNIGLTYCDAADCVAPDSTWETTPVEFGSDIPADQIFLEWNCSIGAWFLHDPSIAITSDGKPRVAYQSRDISGGFSNPDPTKPRCVAGTDMTWSRLAVLDSHK